MHKSVFLIKGKKDIRNTYILKQEYRYSMDIVTMLKDQCRILSKKYLKIQPPKNPSSS